MILSPSILAADLGHLAEEVAAVGRGGAGEIHVDVMDGQFVPNLTLGPAVVKAVCRATSLPVGAHLMVERGERYIDAFVDAGVSSLSLHLEAVPHLQKAMAHIRDRGAEAGVALNPASPLSLLEEILPEVDRVLLMTVNPGFSFQEFLPSSLDKIRRLRDIIEARGLNTRIQIDGGVTLENVRRIVEAGATIVVAGAASFADGDPEAATRRLIEACG